MSRVDDEYAEQQRAREVEDAARYERKTSEKRKAEQSQRQSFSELMSAKQRKELAKKRGQPTPKRVHPEQLHKKGGRALNSADRRRELARQNALRGALNQSTLKRRTKEGEDVHQMLSVRTEEHAEEESFEKEIEEKDFREEEHEEVLQKEERLTEAKLENALYAAIDGQEERKHQHNGQPQQDGSQDDDLHIAVVSEAKRATIPVHLVEELVQTIYQGLDGEAKNTLDIELKGPFAGVTMRVSSRGGQVTCHLKGLKSEMKTMMRQSESELASGLKQRGLRLRQLILT